MDYEKLVSICRHELRLGEDSEVARLIREVKIVQDHSNDIFARLTQKHRIKAWEIMSGYMLAWKYVEDLDGLGSGQRFWKGKTSRPDALIWPEDKKKWSMMTCIQLTILIYARILAGVEKLFIELQDYSMIDRQKNKSRPTPKIGKEADAGASPPPPTSQATITPPTKQGRRKDRQPKADVTLMVPVPGHADSLIQDTELGEQAFGQKEEPKKATSKESCDANPNTDEFAKEPPSRKKALTPPWIPKKDIHQTWQDFAFQNFSQEGFRTLRHRIVKIDESERTPSKTTLRTPRGCKDSRVKADRKQGSAEKYSSTVSTKRRRGLLFQDSKQIRNGHLPSLPNSPSTRHQAASAKAVGNGSPTSEDDCANFEASISVASSSEDPPIPATSTPRSRRKLLQARLNRDRENEKGPESVRQVA